VREANAHGGHLGTPVALPWMHCLYHVLSQISTDCFAQQQVVFIIDCNLGQAAISNYDA